MGSSRNRLLESTPPVTKPSPDKKPVPAPKKASAALVGDSRRTPFPIVGIGASAGGLEALEGFLARVPPGSGMAYVVIQHLDPNHKAIMAELLQRTTRMEVCQARDRMKVLPDHVYVIPPNKDISVLHGVLHLLEPAAPHGLRLPIDFFFRTLAEDRGEASIGIILSGMGSDGTLGLRAIKEKTGMVLVQEPGSAKFDGMPRSAISAGLADIVAPADELPGRLIAALNHPRAVAEAAPESRAQSGLEKIVILLRARTGHDFSRYRKNTMHRRIERRMAIHQLDRIDGYVRFLRENPHELELLFKELLIGVTNFFRDPPAWEYLVREALPELLKANPAGKALRAWVPGCSTGEEAYSLAIAFREALEQLKPAARFSLQIFATDLDADAIEKARQGVYPANISSDLLPERLARFFAEDEGGFRVTKEVREMVAFAPQNLIQDPPFTKLDILSCRNLLIYLGADLQRKLLPLFHYALNPGGLLFLGSAETAGGFPELFAALDSKARIYRRIGGAAVAVDFPTKGTPAPSVEQEMVKERRAVNLQVLADSLLLQRFAPAAVLVNEKGDIVYISGRTGKYLEPAAGKANWNIHAMAREGLRYELTTALQKALRDKVAVTRHGVAVDGNSGTQIIDLSVAPIAEPEALRGMVMIVFMDVPSPAADKAPVSPRASRNAVVAALEAELQKTRAELQTAREEMQTSQEELKSANEELQSTNEELQSANEELSTSKEELQSLNEELQTVNAELQAKLDDLSRANNDMQNLLNSTDIATVFLDDLLHVRRFTTHATRLFKLIPGDVGRPLSDLVTDLSYPELADDAREVLRTLVFAEKPVATRDGRWYSVRIMPYRTMENVISGLVLTFSDISDAKRLEAELRDAVRHGATAKPAGAASTPTDG